MAIFKTSSPSKATRENPAIGSLTGRKDLPPTEQRGEGVKHVPNK